MHTKQYLGRTLQYDDKLYSEAELLASFSHIIVLAEPGGGKTELLNSLAEQLGVKRMSASKFRNMASPAHSDALVLDAFDEVAKVDPSGMYQLFGKVLSTGPKKLVFSSRSSEWSEANTKQFEDFLEVRPNVVRLAGFSKQEQKTIFDHYMPGENFHKFETEVSRFDLEPLLENPQFLQLFAEAFVESGRHFSSKSSIFSLAIERLAGEANEAVPQKGAATVEKKVAYAGEIFAKLLLAGSEGVSVSDTKSDQMYPRLGLLARGDQVAECILETRLFKPGDNADQHQPVHRIVEEFCAARYLVGRIEDAVDPFTLRQCLAVIAPNAIVRDELRGLLGWMAAVGGRAVQEAAIGLDPYAILANGDPSQLLPSSKRKLVDALGEIATDDPWFRRGDIWRTFSASGFFSRDVVNGIRPLIAGKDEHGHLRGLMLELLEGSPAIPMLEEELRTLMLDPEATTQSRTLAHSCLLSVLGHDHSGDVSNLIFEATNTSLNIATKIISKVGASNCDKALVLGVLGVCAHLYPAHMQRHERTIMSRYFVKKFVALLELPLVKWLLDEMTRDLNCMCGKKSFECDCRNGASKIVGSLLDQYFKLHSGPFDPAQVWSWVRGLNFHGRMPPKDSAAVSTMQTNDALRQGILRIIFENETDIDAIWELRFGLLGGQCHAGLHMQHQDWRYLVELAFERDNLALWSSSIATHSPSRKTEDRGPDAMRKHMRQQANSKSIFAAEWARRNRAWKQSQSDQRKRFLRSNRRWNQRERAEADARANSLFQHRALIESGHHWGWLRRLADLYLIEPETLKQEIGQSVDVEKALLNSFSFLELARPKLRSSCIGAQWVRCKSALRSVPGRVSS